MAEELFLNAIDKEAKYKELLPQIESLISGEQDLIANMANVAAALRQAFSFFWVGFYRIVDEELVLGPFQGDIACVRIKKGRGVCGTAWAKKSTLLVADVNEFPGHIACSSQSKSEIVVPLIKNGEVYAVLDIDSDEIDDFDETDKYYLEGLCLLLSSQ